MNAVVALAVLVIANAIGLWWLAVRVDRVERQAAELPDELAAVLSATMLKRTAALHTTLHRALHDPAPDPAQTLHDPAPGPAQTLSGPPAGGLTWGTKREAALHALDDPADPADPAGPRR